VVQDLFPSDWHRRTRAAEDPDAFNLQAICCHAEDMEVLSPNTVPGIYPLLNKQFAIENGHRNSGFSHL